MNNNDSESSSSNQRNQPQNEDIITTDSSSLLSSSLSSTLLFHECAASELPSSTSCYNSLNKYNIHPYYNNKYAHMQPQQHDPQQQQFYRMSTIHHSVTVSDLHKGTININVDSLPKIDTSTTQHDCNLDDSHHHASSSGIKIQNKKERHTQRLARNLLNRNRSCIAHSYLPLPFNDKAYIEAFVMETNPNNAKTTLNAIDHSKQQHASNNSFENINIEASSTSNTNNQASKDSISTSLITNSSTNLNAQQNTASTTPDDTIMSSKNTIDTIISSTQFSSPSPVTTTTTTHASSSNITQSIQSTPITTNSNEIKNDSNHNVTSLLPSFNASSSTIPTPLEDCNQYYLIIKGLIPSLSKSLPNPSSSSSSSSFNTNMCTVNTSLRLSYKPLTLKLCLLSIHDHEYDTNDNDNNHQSGEVNFTIGLFTTNNLGVDSSQNIPTTYSQPNTTFHHTSSSFHDDSMSIRNDDNDNDNAMHNNTKMYIISPVQRKTNIIHDTNLAVDANNTKDLHDHSLLLSCVEVTDSLQILHSMNENHNNEYSGTDETLNHIIQQTLIDKSFNTPFTFLPNNTPISNHHQTTMNSGSSGTNNKNVMHFQSPVLSIDTLSVLFHPISTTYNEIEENSQQYPNKYENYFALASQDGLIKIICIEILAESSPNLGLHDILDEGVAHNDASSSNRNDYSYSSNGFCWVYLDTKNEFNSILKRYQFIIKYYTEIVVDGPILSLSLNLSLRRPIGYFGVDLLVGSLCGFVCLFQQDQSMGPTYHGPFMVTEGLSSNKLMDTMEDSVLCAHSFSCGYFKSGFVVVVGTISGSVLIFAPTYQKKSNSDHGNSDTFLSVHSTSPTLNDDTFLDTTNSNGISSFGSSLSFDLKWQHYLPYPIYGINLHDFGCIGFPALLVSTRKSIHLFKCNQAMLEMELQLRLEDLIRKRSIQLFASEPWK